jgi:MerR family redox-sensitive transcriptional activator SoxR
MATRTTTIAVSPGPTFEWHVDGLTAGEVAARMRIAPSAVRYYADHGLLPHRRTSGNQRRFYPDVLCRVAMIQVSQKVGLSLAQIRRALDGLPPGQVPTKTDWDALSAGLTSTLKGRVQEMFGLLDQLATDLAAPIPGN